MLPIVLQQRRSKKRDLFLKGLLHPAFLARVVSWFAFVVAIFMGHENGGKQKPTKRRHVQGMLDETDPLTSSNISMSTRQRILNCYIWSILMYGCETWSISSVMRKRLEAAEMWFLRRMLKISWTEKISNERVLTIANVKRKMLQTIKKRKMTFLGHVMRRKGIENLSIENLSLTGKVEGKNARGRQRMTYLSNIKEWTNRTNGNELIQACQDREVWRHMILNVLAHDT